jgi:hypothetical protein
LQKKVVVKFRTLVKGAAPAASAFPEQSQAILGALRTWRFKPYREGGRAVAVETGIVFGMPRR